MIFKLLERALSSSVIGENLEALEEMRKVLDQHTADDPKSEIEQRYHKVMLKTLRFMALLTYFLLNFLMFALGLLFSVFLALMIKRMLPG